MEALVKKVGKTMEEPGEILREGGRCTSSLLWIAMATTRTKQTLYKTLVRLHLKFRRRGIEGYVGGVRGQGKHVHVYVRTGFQTRQCFMTSGVRGGGAEEVGSS